LHRHAWQIAPSRSSFVAAHARSQRVPEARGASWRRCAGAA
jgi:hypothetical protein